MKYKCRALFFKSIAICFNNQIIINEEFMEMLDGFFIQYYEFDEKLFDIIFDSDNSEDEEKIQYDNCQLINYLNLLSDPYVAVKIYNDIGDEMVGRITNLAQLFINYVNTLRDMSRLRIRH